MVVSDKTNEKDTDDVLFIDPPPPPPLSPPFFPFLPSSFFLSLIKKTGAHTHRHAPNCSESTAHTQTCSATLSSSLI